MISRLVSLPSPQFLGEKLKSRYDTMPSPLLCHTPPSLNSKLHQVGGQIGRNIFIYHNRQEYINIFFQNPLSTQTLKYVKYLFSILFAFYTDIPDLLYEIRNFLQTSDNIPVENKNVSRICILNWYIITNQQKIPNFIQ